MSADTPITQVQLALNEEQEMKMTFVRDWKQLAFLNSQGIHRPGVDYRKLLFSQRVQILWIFQV